MNPLKKYLISCSSLSPSQPLSSQNISKKNQQPKHPPALTTYNLFITDALLLKNSSQVSHFDLSLKSTAWFPSYQLKDDTWSSKESSTLQNRAAREVSPKWGSTNMPLFGRAHEYKECEHWSEKKVWIVSGMKWTLPKNKGDPHRDTSETWTHSG